IHTSRSGFLKGSGRSNTALTTLKIAVFAPMPSASVSTATAVKPGFFSNWRRANLRSFVVRCQWSVICCPLSFVLLFRIPRSAFRVRVIHNAAPPSERGIHDGSSLGRSEEHTSELQSLAYLVCRLLLEKKKSSSRTSILYPPLSQSTCCLIP